MMKARGKIQSWEISDKFWEKVKNLIPKKERVPKKEYKRAAGAGFFQKIWELGLEEYDEMYGIGWEWQSIRKSIRLKGFDYSSEGIYFVTICIQNRECFYGNIEKEFENIKLDEYIMMPNHLHGIIFIVGAGLVSTQLDVRCENRADTRQNRADTRSAPIIGYSVKSKLFVCRH